MRKYLRRMDQIKKEKNRKVLNEGLIESQLALSSSPCY